ncbi:YdcF family protein [Haliangium ochraceum]|uniref:DUF218 domain-containing protein n=1 Tax=Haliangium ochraceum (strain DSM 14365 / JCM 11303 / SMP-2) TaxID=502025 RepID=D0LM07_HALO1|nr:YdcF family protein [Haliangium ochraceum]ACY15185.1 protein of unknown function DUF218 [Haliangium ochraceum DSM 14365]
MSARAMSRRRALAAPLARALYAPLARRCAVPDAIEPADAIVVLGAPVLAPGRLSEVGRERVDAAVSLYQRGAGPRLCVTGGGPAGRVEADAMAAHARARGLPEEALRIERQARNTEENARFAAAMLRAEGCRSVWLVSQPFHLARACVWFRRCGLEARPWHAPDSVQFREPRRAIKWLLREYAALAALALRPGIRPGIR